MKKLTWCSYQQGETIICFNNKNKKLDKDGKTIIYPFFIKDNPELTKKVLDAVARKYVPESSFHPCAKAVFEMIRTKNFEPVIKQRDFNLLTARFKEKFQCDPQFELKNIGTKFAPRHEAKITCEEVYYPFTCTARTSKSACAKLLKELLGDLPKQTV